MLKTHEIAIGLVARLLIGMLGIIVMVLGAAFIAREAWYVLQGEWLRLMSTGFFLIIFAGGVSLLRSAIKGRLSVRSHHSK